MGGARRGRAVKSEKRKEKREEGVAGNGQGWQKKERRGAESRASPPRPLAGGKKLALKKGAALTLGREGGMVRA